MDYTACNMSVVALNPQRRIVSIILYIACKGLIKLDLWHCIKNCQKIHQKIYSSALVRLAS